MNIIKKQLSTLLLSLTLISPVYAEGVVNIKTPEEYQRKEDQTYLTLPEWFLVHSPEEYAKYLKTERPSEFPFFGHINQFWSTYWSAYTFVKDKYPFNMEYHIVVMVIGVSTTVEYTIKGLYETFVGKLTESSSNDYRVSEDEYAAKVAQEYVDFIKIEPWYKFDFFDKFKNLWTENDLWGDNPLRKFERKYALSTEYLAKGTYGYVIKKATGASFEPPVPLTSVVVTNFQKDLVNEKVVFIDEIDPEHTLLTLPRYGEFTIYSQYLAGNNVNFVEIAGNKEFITVSILPDSAFSSKTYPYKVLLEQQILTDSSKKRVVYEVDIENLSEMLNELKNSNIKVEHIYDY